MLKSSREIEEWLRFKNRILEGLLEERLIGYLDPGAEEIIRVLNTPPLLMTTSSCLGRITVVEGEEHWSRRRARVVYKTHDPIGLEELERVLSRGFESLWLKVSGPIIHFRTPRLSCALYVLNTARRSGFKHSGIVSRNPRLGYAFEVMSSIQLIAPLRARGVELYKENALRALVDEANSLLWKSRERLSMLAYTISRDHGFCSLDTRE